MINAGPGGSSLVQQFIPVVNCVHSAIRSNTSTGGPDGWGGWGAPAVGRFFPVFEVCHVDSALSSNGWFEFPPH